MGEADLPGLLISQRFDWLQPRSTIGRVNPKEQSHNGGEDRRQRNGIQTYHWRECSSARRSDLSNAKRDQPAEEDPDDPADQTQQRRLGQELDQNVASARAESLP